MDRAFEVIVIGGGHAGVEAAWAAANLLRTSGSVALVTLDASKIGVMSCNPAIGGLAKGQLVREIDALGGLMGLATDATGIQFKTLNTSRGPAVHGPRAQCDKHAYARQVRRMIAARPEIVVIEGSVERLIVEAGRIRGVEISHASERAALRASSVVLTTGTFMRGLMHTGESRTPGGRFGEKPAMGISDSLRGLGFELGRLKTGTPPRLKRSSIRWEELEEARGDEHPVPFSELSALDGTASEHDERRSSSLRHSIAPSIAAFPVLPQVDCRQTSTSERVHGVIRANLHRAPMFTGQIESVGPRYCPSIEDKVVRFADRESHTVFLEPESLDAEHAEWVYCNGISTSLPADVQDTIVRALPGCERAEILRYGYAVEYDMVRPHQIHVTGMSKLVEGLFLAGQINGTSGYEEAAAQGLVAGVNAALRARGGERGSSEFVLGRDEAYIGVLMDDLVTKTPVEPYRMFTSRAEHRILLRPDNAGDRLTPRARELGLLGPDAGGLGLGPLRDQWHQSRAQALRALHAIIEGISVEGVPLSQVCRRTEFDEDGLRRVVRERFIEADFAPGVWTTAFADRKYEPYVERQRAEIKRHAEMERRRVPADLGEASLAAMRPEARQAVLRFRPGTFGQAARLEGMTPADLTLLAVLVRKHAAGA